MCLTAPFALSQIKMMGLNSRPTNLVPNLDQGTNCWSVSCCHQGCHQGCQQAQSCEWLCKAGTLLLAHRCTLKRTNRMAREMASMVPAGVLTSLQSVRQHHLLPVCVLESPPALHSQPGCSVLDRGTIGCLAAPCYG